MKLKVGMKLRFGQGKKRIDLKVHDVKVARFTPGEMGKPSNAMNSTRPDKTTGLDYIKKKG
jgi:hypothetical protein